MAGEWFELSRPAPGRGHPIPRKGYFEEIREKYPCNTEGRWLRIVVASMKERPLVSGKLSSVCVKRLRGSLRIEKRDRGLSQA